MSRRNEKYELKISSHLYIYKPHDRQFTSTNERTVQCTPDGIPKLFCLARLRDCLRGSKQRAKFLIDPSNT